MREHVTPRETIDAFRRGLLCRGMVVGALSVSCGSSTRAHASFGPVEPRLALPPVSVTGADGRRVELASQLVGHVTAMQLMFTGCSATCPIQGALFSKLQAKLGGGDVRLLSVSIDPRGDDPRAMQAWLLRHGADPSRWTGVVPQEGGVERLQDVLKGRAVGTDRHTPQVYVLDRRGRLMYRSEDLPNVDALARLIQGLSDRA